MSVTLPTYDWNFLTTKTVGDVIYDQISNQSATYETNIASDTTNGATCSANNGRIRIDNSSISLTSTYSIEYYVRCNGNRTNSDLFILNKQDNTNKIRCLLYSSKLNFQQYSGGNTDIVTALNSNYTGSAISTDGTTFNHFVFTVDNPNGTAYIYQNGVKIYEETGLTYDSSVWPMTFSSYIILARWSGLSEISFKTFRLWPSHALSTSEITTLYDNRDTANYISTLITPTLPKYNWNFLTTGAANSTHLDSISNSTATYGSNVTSDATNGATVDTDNITLPSIAFSSRIDVPTQIVKLE